MDVQEMKQYLKQVFDVEMALYTHKKAISEYKKQREAEIPDKPELNLPFKPDPPKLASFTAEQKYVSMADIKNEDVKFKIGGCMVLGIIASIWGGIGVLAILDQLFCGGYVFNNDDAIGLMILLALIFPVGIIFLRKALKIWKQATEDIVKNDENLRSDYERKLKFYQLEETEIKSKYERAIKVYENDVAELKTETKKQLQEMDSLLISLENCLEKLYSQNIVYSKYRNLIAVATIYEYFESGRCCELEGPNGAYNMFENELRANIIIGSLNQIISDIQQIKNGQYALYQELYRSNKMLENIADNTRLTAYYANVAAVAASADRYIVGMVW